MDGVETLLEEVRKRGLAQGRFRGLLHILIGRRVTRSDGAVVSSGLTWRTVADLLRRLRWDPEMVRELGIEPDSLPPRDRQRYWFTAISQAQIGSATAVEAADELAGELRPLGYEVGPAPRTEPGSSS